MNSGEISGKEVKAEVTFNLGDDDVVATAGASSDTGDHLRAGSIDAEKGIPEGGREADQDDNNVAGQAEEEEQGAGEVPSVQCQIDETKV